MELVLKEDVPGIGKCEDRFSARCVDGVIYFMLDGQELSSEEFLSGCAWDLQRNGRTVRILQF